MVETPLLENHSFVPEWYPAEGDYPAVGSYTITEYFNLYDYDGDPLKITFDGKEYFGTPVHSYEGGYYHIFFENSEDWPFSLTAMGNTTYVDVHENREFTISVHTCEIKEIVKQIDPKFVGVYNIVFTEDANGDFTCNYDYNFVEKIIQSGKCYNVYAMRNSIINTCYVSELLKLTEIIHSNSLGFLSTDNRQYTFNADGSITFASGGK